MRRMPGADLQGVSRAHILFYALAGGTAQLDCVGESDGRRGWPFTLMLDLPETADWARVVRRLLRRWANEAATITMSLESNQDAPRVRMSDGQSAVRLDLVDIRLDPVV